MKINLNDEIKIDLSRLVESRLLIQANSGGGKSWAIRRLLEQSHGKVQHIILDPEGEFSTLREKYDYVLAGKEGDTVAEPKSAAMLAKMALQHKFSLIVDLYELQPQERKRFVRLFLEAMVNAPKELWHDVIVVIDEAHVFAPEKGESEAASAVIDLATRGRKRGFCAVLATQRISKLAKDAAAECNNKLIGRCVQDIDMARASEELGFTTREQKLSLRSLNAGEFFAFGTAISTEVIKTKIGEVKTSHPKAGARSLTKTTPPTKAIKDILGKLADLPKEAEKEAKTAQEMKAEIHRLKGELRIAQTGGKADTKAIEKAVKETEAKKDREWKGVVATYVKEIKPIKEALDRIFNLANDAKRFTTPPLYVVETPKLKQEEIVPGAVIKPQNRPARALVHSDIQEGEDVIIDRPMQKVLDAIAWLNSIGVDNPAKEAVALVADYRPTSGGYANICGKLRAAGLVVYPQPNLLALTEAGRQAANHPDSVASQSELHERVLRVLSEPERKILRPLLRTYPSSLSHDELASEAGYEPTSGGLANLKGRLRTCGLVIYPQPNHVQAAAILFPEQ